MRHVPVILIAALAAGGCRGKNIESEPGPVYLVVVENPMSHVMDVWYDDGEATEELGRIDPGQTREYVIAAPADTTIDVIGRDDGRTHTVTRTVELVRGSTVRVVLTP